MKVLVGVKQVVDYNVKIQVKSDHSGIVSDGVKLSMNPFDEIAVEQAIRLKEQGVVTEVVLLSVGALSCEEVLRYGLALGADRAILIAQNRYLVPLNIARIFQSIVVEQQSQLVILGKQAIDDDCNQTGQMLAALLGWPQATFVSQLDITGTSTARVMREIDSGLETIDITLPAVITVDLRLNEPRYASLPNIMRAKQKPLIKQNLDQLDIEMNDHYRVTEVTPPPQRQAGISVNTFDDLFTRLTQQGLV